MTVHELSYGRSPQRDDPTDAVRNFWRTAWRIATKTARREWSILRTQSAGDHHALAAGGEGVWEIAS
jgi:hypothetical protein